MATMVDGQQQLTGMIPATSFIMSQRNIRLVDLIEMLVQRSYHDLLVLTEIELLNPRKSDLDRKVAIMQYLSRTRNFFVRFLALLKWSSNMPKVEKCFSIISYLEEQSVLFVETADVLARMSRETMANSKLPCYQVSFAVDVLNSRTCPRLPACIKDKIVPPDPLTDSESDDTIREIEYALLHRLVTTDRPPSAMRSFVIRRGRVVFTVENEFVVTLTVMGDDKSMPFCVLDVGILVRNRRVGEGRPLVHPQQVKYLRELVQSRIVESEKPLDEVYEVLHDFCQSLKLEVLFTQLSKYMLNTGLDYYRIESYKPGREIKLAYWEDFSNRDPTKTHSVTITTNPDQEFLITHHPSLESHIPLEELDIGAFLITVIHSRSKTRIEKLEKELSPYFHCSSEGLPLVLSVSLYPGCPKSQNLIMSVDYYTGLFTVQLKEFTSPKTQNIQENLNKSLSVVSHIKQLYLELILHLIRLFSVNLLFEHTKLPLYGGEAFQRFQNLPSTKALFRFQKKVEITALLSVSVSDDLHGVRVDYHILMVEVTGSGVKICGMIEREKLLEENVGREMIRSTEKAEMKSPLELLKSRLGQMKAYRGAGVSRQVEKRFRPAVLDGLEETITTITTHVMFSELRTVLKAKGLVSDAAVIKPSEGVAYLPVRIAHPLVRSCIFRRVGKLHVTTQAVYNVDVVFSGVPFQENDAPVPVTLSYDSAVNSEQVAENFVTDWTALLNLLRIMRRFSKTHTKKPDSPPYTVDYKLKHVTILYGPALDLVLYLTWDRTEKKLVLEFYSQSGTGWNPHRALRSRLMEHLNRPNPVEFSRLFEIVLNTTPLILGARDSARPVGVVKMPRNLTPQATFQFLAVSLSHYVVVWKGVYGVFVRVWPGGKFMVTDLGGTEIAKGAEEGGKYLPIPGLKAAVDSVVKGRVDKVEDVVDKELAYGLGRFFARLKGCTVQVTGTTSGV